MYWANNSNFSKCHEFIHQFSFCPLASAAVERLFSLGGLRTYNRRKKTPEISGKLVKIAF